MKIYTVITIICILAVAHAMLLLPASYAQTQPSEPEITILQAEYPATTMTLTEDGKFLIVAHEEDNKLTVWNSQTGRLDRTLNCDAPRSILCRGKNLFVANYGKGTISVFSLAPDWKMTDQVLAGNKDVYYLSAPQGKNFRNLLLATCGAYANHLIYSVDVRNDSNKEVAKETYMSVATVDYSGKHVILQGERSHSPSATIQALDYEMLISSKREFSGRGEHEATPIIYQTRGGSLWFGGTRVFAGIPPKLMSDTTGFLVVPDVAGEYFYVLGKDSVDVMRTNIALTKIASRKISYPQEVKTDGSLRQPGEDTRTYVFCFPQAVHFDKDVVCFFKQGFRIFHCSFHGLLSPAEPAVAGAPVDSALAGEDAGKGMPDKIVEGQSFQHAIFGKDVSGEFSIITGSKNASISSNGVLNWTPTSVDIGVHNFKIMAIINGETSFQRFTIEVIPSALAGKVADDLSKIDDLGTHYLAGEKVSIDYLSDRSGILLQNGHSLRILDADGMLVVKDTEFDKSYSRIQSRREYFVAVSGHTVDIIDKTTFQVKKSFEIKCDGINDFVLHPTAKIAYISVADSAGGTRNAIESKRILYMDELTGKYEYLPRVYGQWLAVDPGGTAIYTAIKDTYQSGYHIDWYIGEILPSYGSIDILVSYGLSGSNVTHRHTNFKPGANGICLRMSPDGAFVSYVSGGGYRSGSPSMASYTIPAFNTKDIRNASAAYNVDAYPADVAYHPKLKLVAGTNGKDVKIFDRQTGELLSGRCAFKDENMTDIQRIFFTPGGKHLMVNYRNAQGRRVFKTFGLVLSTDELQEAARPASYSRPAGTGQQVQHAIPDAAPKKELPSQSDISILMQSGTRAMSTKEISDRYADTVVVVKSDSGAGSGFFITKSGFILTCAHVLPRFGSVNISYRITKGPLQILKETNAEITAMDEIADLALLKINIDQTPALPVRLEQYAVLAQGEEVSIIGNPGIGSNILDYTMTKGIVSSVARLINGHKFIQTTAAVNPGNSGSPLFNDNGNVIGLVVLKADMEGVGFAIPADVIQKFLSHKPE